jgi:hypothetical protein
MRHDFSGNTLTIRASDLGVLQQIVSGGEGSLQDVLEALVAK